MFSLKKKSDMPSSKDALPGRDKPMLVADAHYVNGRALKPPFPENMEQAMFGLGCFWGAERRFWEQSGVYTTAVGYAGGPTLNPTYQEVCGGLTGHTEVVLVVFDPSSIGYEDLLRQFWEGHDPTQGMRQGNDVGTQYRSAIHYFSDRQREWAETTKRAYEDTLRAGGHDLITTEIVAAPEFYYAEAYHQQYLAKNPHGYCGLGGTGVSCPVSLEV